MIPLICHKGRDLVVLSPFGARTELPEVLQLCVAHLGAQPRTSHTRRAYGLAG